MPEKTYTLRIQGRPESGTRGGAARPVAGDAAGLGEFSDLVSTELLAGVQVEAVRGAGTEEVEASGDDLVEVLLEGGIHQWMTVDELAGVTGAPASRGGIGGEVEDGVVRVPVVFRYDSPTRGLGGFALKVLRVFRVKVPADWLADLAAPEIAERLEDRLEPGPGLYPCPDPRELGPPVDEPGRLPRGGPLLVFLHGTASSTAGSFGELTGSREAQAAWRSLRERYGERIYALQHRTLSRSPAHNALELLDLLPEAAELHLVSHSRGGLVGELLCRGTFADGRPAFTEEELGRLDGRGDVATLRELSRRLAEKRPRVTRFVRVACPARGTTLASRRLDHYLSAMLNALGLVPALAASQVFRFTKAALLALARKRADVDDLPGLEAMMPESPLISVLNTAAERVDSDLTVIAGDIEGRGVMGKLKVWATNLFYRDDHDLVVNTAAMSGGALRVAGRARRFFDQGPEVNHFRYFANPESRSRLVAALLAADDRGLEGFEPLVRGEGTRGLFAPSALCDRGEPEKLAGQRPAVVVLPGIMGSSLSVGGDRIWLDPLDIAFGGLGHLLAESPGVDADRLLPRSYGRLLERLSESHEVLGFPYDWRHGLDQAADQLASFLGRCLEATEQPIRLLAHSMGGLVVLRLATVARHRELWQRVRGRGGFRLVMLGTPTRGSHAISSVLLGQEKMVGMLAKLDIGRGVAGVLDVVGGYQGMLELLPAAAGGDGAGEGDDLFDRATWERWRQVQGEPVKVPDADVLADAGSFRRELDRADLPTENVCYVAGRAPRTPKAVEVRSDGGGERVVVLATNRGDGRVPWETGIPPGVPTWYAEVSHGALADAPELFDAVVELLDGGTTGRLPRQPPADVRGSAAERLIELPESEPALFPDAEDLELAVLGAQPGPARATAAALRPLRVRVVWGSLVFASHPVLVGHYRDDVISSAEAVLDSRVMGGRLSERRDLGLYPGEVGSGEAVLDPADPRRGALVAGLGPVGELSPGRIIAGVRRAVLEYAIQVAECSSWSGERDGRRSCGISALLIGTGDGSGIDLDDSLRAVVRGVSEAVETLGRSKLVSCVSVDSLEIVELFEHRALCAAEALLRLCDSAPPVVSVPLVCEPRLGRVAGGQDFIPCPGAGDWWRRIKIASEAATGGEPTGETSLRFSSLTDRARAEESLVGTQQRLVDGFVQRSIGSAEWRREQAETLFELLLPNELKQYAPDRRDLMLILDPDSARFPWELLADGLGAGDEPMAIRAGLIRQLTTGTYRREVRTTAERTALVIGDPPTGSSLFPRLPGARREAEETAQRLTERGWMVRPLIGSSPESVVSALYSTGYRLVHIAAHGTFDPERPWASGVVLDDGLRLTPNELEQMRRVPEMAFVNCCHLGRTDEVAEVAYRDRNRLAASVGVQLIRMGVRAVVVAGWVVDDAAAATFARTLYDRLLAGATFGDAVREARRETYLRHPGVNTWGAYQCYGDPDFRLDDGERGSVAAERSWVDSSRLLSELDNLSSRAMTGSDPATLRRELLGLEELIEGGYAEWLGRFDVCRSLGEAWAELAQVELARRPGGSEDGGERPVMEALDRAIDYLDRAILSGKATVSLGAAQDRLYLRALRAMEPYRAARRERPEEGAQEERERAERELTELRDEYRALTRVLPSPGSLGGEGGVGKRLAEVRRSRAESREALRQAADAFAGAWEAYRTGDTEPRYHATVNYATARVLAELVGADAAGWEPPGAVEELVAEVRQLAGAIGGGSFWGRQAAAEVRLLELLWARSRPGETEDPATPAELADAFASALGRGGSSLHARTVLGNLACMVGILEDRTGDRKTVEVDGAERPAPRVQALADVRALHRMLLDRLS